ncbi:MAG: hypothetical protein JJ891_06690 [Rhizobiaceae bacterium]|jgi:hypothetical protein|nr:hypothetical protein [Rhizobiaceae bacterium]
MSNPFTSKRDTIYAVNLDLFAATCFALLSYYLWPSSYEWWAFGLYSIIMGLASFLSLISAFKKLRQERRRQKGIDEIAKGKKKPKSSGMMSEERMKDLGMLQ